MTLVLDRLAGLHAHHSSLTVPTVSVHRRCKILSRYLQNSLPIELENTVVDTQGALNNVCGTDFLKVNQKVPPSLADVLKPGV